MGLIKKGRGSYYRGGGVGPVRGTLSEFEKVKFLIVLKEENEKVLLESRGDGW